MPTLPDETGLSLSQEMEPFGVIGPMYVEKMGCPHEAETSEPTGCILEHFGATEFPVA